MPWAGKVCDLGRLRRHAYRGDTGRCLGRWQVGECLLRRSGRTVSRMDMLRLAGSPGVGKSAVGWAVAERLAGRGERVAYVDIDQLGMCYPAPQGDPERWALKERALGRISAHFQNAGVARLVVSGVALPDLPPPEHPAFSVRSLWLDAAAEIRHSRLAPRGWSPTQIVEVVSVGSAEAARVDRSWERLPTDRLTLDQTVNGVLSRWTFAAADRAGLGEPGLDRGILVATPDNGAVAGGTIPVLWITGPRCAGASSVGWLIAADAWRAGRRAGFADVAQLSFVWHVETPVGLHNVAALQETYAAAGAEMLVVVSPLGIAPAAVRTAFDKCSLSIVRLVASEADLAHRALARTRGEGPMVAGDDLLSATGSVVRAVIASSFASQSLAVRPGEIVVDTSGTDAAVAAARVKASAGW